MSKTAFITFDLHRETGDYKTAYTILAKLGFFVTTPSGGIVLPNTTVMGTIPDDWRAETLRDTIEQTFRTAGVNLASILCGIVPDWVVTGPRADQSAARR